MEREEDVRGISKWELDTPCLVLDGDILEKNIGAMQDHVASFGKRLRPHAKTHKCSRLARMQMDAGAVGICVAKVSEAEMLVREGLRGVLITSPVVTQRKILRLLDCVSIDPGLMVVVDSVSNAQMLDSAAGSRGATLNVLVDMDPGLGRTGVSFSEGLKLGVFLQGLPHLRLRGVQCYAGHLQHVSSFEERRRLSLECMREAAEVVHQFRTRGLNCEIYTGAGTGTYEIDCEVPELTDLQVGSYVMMDAEYLAVGSSRDPARFSGFPPALTLLSTVVSANHHAFVTVDAGLKALYRDGGTPYVLHPPGVVEKYDWYGDEHGLIVLKESARRPGLGQVLELVVSHCDPTVNLFDRIYVTRSEVVVNVWPIDMRGKCQ